MFHNNPTPANPDTHTTRLIANDRFVSCGVTLGDLVGVRRYSAWHNTQSLYEVRFRRGSIDMSQDTLIALVRQGAEAIRTRPHDPDCSAIIANLEEHTA
jgi:hypothetical protein